MGSTRDRFEPFLARVIRTRYPDVEVLLTAAFDAYDAIVEAGAVTPDLLAPIVASVESSRRPVYENTVDLLRRLSENHGAALAAIEKLARDRRAHVRFNAILCLGKETPGDFTLSILRAGLRDKSARVRQKAADWAGRLRSRDMVPDLAEASKVEADPKTRETIEFELRLLRDGYIIEPAEDGVFSITTHSRSGVRGCHVTQATLEQRGIEAIVAELAAPRAWE